MQTQTGVAEYKLVGTLPLRIITITEALTIIIGATETVITRGKILELVTTIDTEIIPEIVTILEGGEI